VGEARFDQGDDSFRLPVAADNILITRLEDEASARSHGTELKNPLFLHLASADQITAIQSSSPRTGKKLDCNNLSLFIGQLKWPVVLGGIERR